MREGPKMAAARRLIAWHFEVEPQLRDVYLVRFNENDDTPIKLLEINAGTIEAGVEPYTFAPTDEIPYTTVVAAITPNELKDLRRDPKQFPKGWSLDGAKRIKRPARRKHSDRNAA